MKQVTLVAWYGQKMRRFEKYVGTCQQQIAESRLRQFFVPYHINQVHGTIVGLERLIGSGRNFNANIWREREEKREMDFGTVLQLIRTHPGFTIRFGGFSPYDTSINSFGKTAYIRSFQVQWAQKKVTTMGWHHTAGDFSKYTELWDLRKNLGDQCNVAHKYNNDSDFFMAIGDLTNLDQLNDEELAQIKNEANAMEHAVRDRIAMDPEFRLDLKVDDANIFVVQYEEESLPLSSTRAFCVSRPDVDANFIAALYDC